MYTVRINTQVTCIGAKVKHTITCNWFQVAAEEAKADVEEPIEASVKIPPAEAPAPAPAADPSKQAPAFEKALDDKSVKVGKAVKLGVKVSGKPVPKVVFFKNGAEMEEEGGK